MFVNNLFNKKILKTNRIQHALRRNNFLGYIFVKMLTPGGL